MSGAGFRRADGTVGWMSGRHAFRSAHRAGNGQGPGANPAKAPLAAKVVGQADPGAIADLKSCIASACHIRSEDIDGWIAAKPAIWGVGEDEVFNERAALIA